MSSEQSIFERENKLVIRISNVEYKLRLEIAKKHCPNFRLYSKTTFILVEFFWRSIFMKNKSSSLIDSSNSIHARPSMTSNCQRKEGRLERT